MGQEFLWVAVPLGLIYMILFWVFSLRIPCLPLVLIFGLAPFQNDISGLGWLHFSIAEVHLLLSIPLLLLRGWRGELGWMSWELWGALLLTFGLTLPSWRDNSAVSLIQMGLYWIGAVAVFSKLPRRKSDFEPAFLALLLVGCLLAVGALLNGSSYFWGLHKNGVGASLACAFILALERWLTAERRLRMRYLAALALIASGLLIVLSRGAWLATAVGVAFLLAWRGMYQRLLQLGIFLVPVLLLMWTLVPEPSREYATSFDAKRYNIRARALNTEWAMAQWKSSPWLGVGVGLRKEYDATNVFWLTLAETGPLGLLAFLGVHGKLLGGAWFRRGGGGGRESLLPLAGALVAAKFAHGLVDHYWSRGAIMIAWASVGMALFGEDKLSMQGLVRLRHRRKEEPREAVMDAS